MDGLSAAWPPGNDLQRLFGAVWLESKDEWTESFFITWTRRALFPQQAGAEPESHAEAWVFLPLPEGAPCVHGARAAESRVVLSPFSQLPEPFAGSQPGTV